MYILVKSEFDSGLFSFLNYYIHAYINKYPLAIIMVISCPPWSFADGLES